MVSALECGNSQNLVSSATIHRPPSQLNIYNRRLSKKNTLWCLSCRTDEWQKLFVKWRDFTIQLLCRRGAVAERFISKGHWASFSISFTFLLAQQEITALFQWLAKNLNAISLNSLIFKWFVIHLDERCYRDVKSLSSLWQRIVVWQTLWIMNEKNLLASGRSASDSPTVNMTNRPTILQQQSDSLYLMVSLSCYFPSRMRHLSIKMLHLFFVNLCQFKNFFICVYLHQQGSICAHLVQPVPWSRFSLFFKNLGIISSNLYNTILDTSEGPVVQYCFQGERIIISGSLGWLQRENFLKMVTFFTKTST